MDEISEQTSDQKSEIDDQLILRLPPKYAQKVHDILQKKPKKLKKALSIDLDVENKTGVVTLNKKEIPGRLVNLPTILESNKCVNKVHLFKTADISQMLVCGPETAEGGAKNKKNTDKSNTLLHGLAPPLKNVKKYRFRKPMRNTTDIHESEVEKEILWLLRMDNCAVSSKFEVFYEDEDKGAQDNVDEKYIFGDIISDDSEHESSSDVNEIIEYTN